MASLSRHDLSVCPANHARPPGSPSNSLRIFSPHPVTFSPTLRSRKSFSGNTYGSPRKCCKQKTYGRANFFSCNTYKKQGEGTPPCTSLSDAHPESANGGGVEDSSPASLS